MTPARSLSPDPSGSTGRPVPALVRSHVFRLLLCALLLGGVLASLSRLSAQPSPAPLDGFDEGVRAAMTAWRVPGLAVAVVKDGDIVFAKGYGVRTLGSEARVDTATRFAIGSTTKAMTAVALGMLVDGGLVGWDEPVIHHLPWFALSDAHATREITIRDLLTHRTGVGNTDYLWYGREATTLSIIERLRYVELETSVRSHFSYQNVMYAAAGEVVAAVSGQPWSTVVQTRIFDPLGMDDTIPTAASLGELSNVASPHAEIDGSIEVIENASVDAIPAAGAVWSSVADMAAWMIFLLDGGVTDGRRLISDETHRELFTPQTIVGPDGFYPTARLTEPNRTTYSLGFFQQDYAGHQVDFHTGSIDGMAALLGLIRSERLGVYVLANLDHAELRHALMYDVFDRYLGRPARDWSTDLQALYADLARDAEARRTADEAARVAGTTPSHDLADYAGTYGDPAYGAVTITLGDGALRADFGPGFSGRLAHWHYDTFRAEWDAAWRGTALLTFRLDSLGRVAQLTANGRTFDRQD